jgi:hypothetical protein
MATAEQSVTSTSPSRLPLRVGLVLAGLLGVAQIATAAAQLPDGLGYPLILFAVVGAGLVAIVLAWRGSKPARIVVVIATVLPALTGLPAFFVSGVPAMGRVAAAVGILLSIVVAVLVLRPQVRR